MPDPTGPWLSYDDVPPLRRQFDLNRDPLIAKQMLDLEKTEAKRREEQAGRSKAQDKPKTELKPKFQRGGNLTHQQSWLKAERDAVLAGASPIVQAQKSRSYEHSKEYQRQRQR